MLITFTGRNSGRQFTTPVRYFRDGETVRSFTSAESQWWRNLRGGADVVLRIEGRDAPYRLTRTTRPVIPAVGSISISLTDGPWEEPRALAV